MLGPLGSVTNSHWALANGKESYRFKELKCYKFLNCPSTGLRMVSHSTLLMAVSLPNG
jgi:hypothetical protein